ncbi:TetR/AcrR family transcriptional regulator [Nannocystis sp. ILAH1]|uniref:TetR/AcrR family transcriptional regulator n=1 Tax=unclassified Nannocystis TaxID=2627009 RepID=UPI00226FD8E9|nr:MULTISPECIES: TetR/AcrR family transcriptional regulator [unclassified Nannocystis]MCY0995202.1 TetR/AcrR family transcriptional regulator [Nannocystis sp. ILAH1]MCY1068175.1 TetR/AcrR family transcriptional regulator [Nannocystis sp. RBIL2]
MTTQATRRRGDDLLRSIHEAVLAELAEVGLGRLTMEGIARRARTAKTSLYRRWSSPHEVLLDAIHSEHPEEVPSPSADDLRGDLLRALRQLVEWTRSPTAAAAAAILAERKRYPELAAALYERVFDARGGRFTLTVLRHYAARGHIDPALITPVVADIGEALVLKHSLDADAPPSEETLAAIVDQAILPAVGRGRAAR